MKSTLTFIWVRLKIFKKWIEDFVFSFAEFFPFAVSAHGIIEDRDFINKTNWLKVPSHYPGGYFLQIVKIDKKNIYVNGQQAFENKCMPEEVKPTPKPTKKPKPKKREEQSSAKQAAAVSTRKEKEQVSNSYYYWFSKLERGFCLASNPLIQIKARATYNNLHVCCYCCLCKQNIATWNSL